ncbi:MAG: alpha/beta hydrolase [Actinomycetales bacterium]|nr:MAG: alpha/beta hydrolase [Actinomycetales bacterium]
MSRPAAEDTTSGRPVPDWFVDALAHVPQHRTLTVAGHRVAYRTWGEPGDPAIVLVHGAAAHSGWWDHVAPLLARAGHHVLAPDLGGHGDSDRLPAYGLSAWSEEVAAVVATVDRPLLVGHSLGGLVAYLVAESGADLRGLLVVDAEVPEHAEEFTPPDWRPPRQARTYPDEQTIVGRFRTLPRASTSAEHVVRHVAHGSVVETPDGWTWKFDPRFFEHDRIGLDDLRPVDGCPVRLLRGADGLVDDLMASRVAERLGHPGPPVTIPDSGHHVPLDQPLALVEVVLDAATRWASTPRPDRPATLEEAP